MFGDVNILVLSAVESINCRTIQCATSERFRQRFVHDNVASDYHPPGSGINCGLLHVPHVLQTAAGTASAAKAAGKFFKKTQEMLSRWKGKCRIG